MKECDVKVGTHSSLLWRDKKSGLVVCSHHRAQYEQRIEDLGPFAWEPVEDDDAIG